MARFILHTPTLSRQELEQDPSNILQNKYRKVTSFLFDVPQNTLPVLHLAQLALGKTFYDSFVSEVLNAPASPQNTCDLLNINSFNCPKQLRYIWDTPTVQDEQDFYFAHNLHLQSVRKEKAGKTEMFYYLAEKGTVLKGDNINFTEHFVDANILALITPFSQVFINKEALTLDEYISLSFILKSVISRKFK